MVVMDDDRSKYRPRSRLVIRLHVNRLCRLHEHRSRLYINRPRLSDSLRLLFNRLLTTDQQRNQN